jgi:hypothetical protein
MFAYGTGLVFIVEWDRDASFALLALPLACAISSVLIALYVLRGVHSWWPEHSHERFSFGFDLFLTAVYMSAWVLLLNGFIVETQKDVADIVILVCWNIGVFTAFYPLLRQVYRHPETEHAMPWMIWTLAYFMLALATFFEVGSSSELILYPLINLLVHGFIALHTARWRFSNGLRIV